MTLTLKDARQAINGAIARAGELEIKVTVTVCDDQGRLVALNRMDGALETSDRDSIGKAIAAAATGRPSSEAITAVDFSLRAGTVIGEGAPVIHRRGGMPIHRDGVLIGACGVSGATDSEQDENCAHAGVAALLA
jgi:glc operon protein GlcG